MEYKDFLCATLFRLTNELGDRIDVDMYESLKNNGSLRKGIIIREKNKNIGPVIYLEEFYERFNKGITLDRIVEEIITFYKKIRCPESWKVDDLLDFSTIQKKLAVKLINYSKNKEYLKDYPYVKYLDLAIIFYVVLDIKREGIATVVVTNDYMNAWDITKTELFDIALKNSSKILPAKFLPMKDMLESLMFDEEQSLSQDMFKERDVMYVLTNEQKNCGAACMLYKGVLEMIGDILSVDFYIIPSSIHEVLIVPVNKEIDTECLDSIIDDMNSSYVEKEELLGNHCYIYDRINKEVRFGYDSKF